MLRLLSVSTRYPNPLQPNLGNFVRSQALALAARPGVQVEVIAPLATLPFGIALPSSPSGLTRLPLEEGQDGLLVHRPRFARMPRLPGFAIGSLTQALDALAPRFAGRFDLVCAEFAWPEPPAVAALAARLQIPFTIKARGIELGRALARPAARARLLAAARPAARLLAISEDVRGEMIAAGLPPERIHVHHPGVDGSLFRPIDKAAVKARLGQEGPLLISVGNLISEKGQDLAITALASIPGAVLIIVGAGPRLDALKALASTLGVSDRVRFTGSLPWSELPPLYAAADVALHTPLADGFANVRLEALSSGTPLVTTAVGDAQAIVRDRDHGRIVAAEPEAIAAAVRELLASSPNPEKVREAAASFSWERNARELEIHLRAAAGRA